MTGEKNDIQQPEAEMTANGEELKTGHDAGAEESPDQAAEIEGLQAELAAGHDRLLRMAAEQENFKKRMERERENLLKYAGESILRELLATMDNLERALELAGNEAANPELGFKHIMDGVELTRKGLLATLEKFQVKPMDSLGAPFDPNHQEALTMEASDEVPANHVLREFIRGYTFKDRLLRAAKVVVSNGPVRA